MIVIDVEVYRNYFLLSALQLSSGKVVEYEMYENHPAPIAKIAGLMGKNTTISFNGNAYDLLIIRAVLDGYDCQQLKKLSDLIIVSDKPAWAIARDANLSHNWNHIDLIEVAPGQASLKVYGGRMGAPRMQDLPIDPSANITPNQRAELRKYCLNDLDVTARLYRTLEKQIDLRSQMTRKYGMDLRSKSDAQIAETVIKSELAKLTGKDYRPPKLEKGYGFKYRNPGIIAFESETLQSIFNRILSTEFELGKNGSVLMPDWLKAERVTVAGREYQMGIGGLHSCEKRQAVVADSEHFLADWDVASYYPSIILQQGLYPKQLGREFLTIYQSIVERRLDAKKRGHKVTADTLKITINGSFGKFGSKYSALYSPDLLIQTTITGQLALLMLIERMAAIGVETVSANTDGVVLHGNRSLSSETERVAWDWMLDTSYTLERTEYSVLASRDVNNYLAVKPDGSVKGKGCFAETGLMKNPEHQIVHDAVKHHVAKGTPIEQTIMGCLDVTKFLTVRKVTGGAIWDGEHVGKTVRFYYANSVPHDRCILYAKNGNRVPKSAGSKPLMDLPDGLPNDIDYAVYIEAAEKLISEIGYVGKNY
jgi:hypothetical protein